MEERRQRAGHKRKRKDGDGETGDRERTGERKRGK
jgi:hypothetical protein